MADMLRDTLLELLPDEALVDEFLNRVDETNAIAATRIARSVADSTDTPGEDVEDVAEEVEEDVATEEETEEIEETEEVVEQEETEEEEVVEEIEEVVEENEDEDIEIVLDENFVSDLARSAEFQAAVNTAVDARIEQLRAEFQAQFQALETEVEEERQWRQDVPARRKRATVSYRAREVAEDGEPVETKPATYAEIANDSVSQIFN